MSSRKRLFVRVNDDLVLDAGECEHVEGPDGLARVVHPPQTALFHQVLNYLQAKPEPETHPSGSGAGREGVAAAAVTLRWGSYFCVLAEGSKPLWDAASSPGVSCISDEEMARIDIEASAAMAAWIDLYRGHPQDYARLVERAVAYLPMPVQTSTRGGGAFWELSDPGHAHRLVKTAEQVWDAERIVRARTDAERHPTRVFANAAVNVAWRNGPVENIHAGWARDFPLDQRRVTPDAEQLLMAFASDGFAMALAVCERFASERPGRPWTEQVQPYALAKMMLITPTGWTLTEVSREVRF